MIDRERELVVGLLVALMIAGGVAVVGGTIFIVLHFIAKFW